MNNDSPASDSSPSLTTKTRLTPEARIALAYLFFAVLWILLSDRALSLVVKDAEMIKTLQTYKGLAFVTLTALLLFVLIRRELVQRRRTEAALRTSDARFRRVFESDMVGVIFWDRNGDITEANRVFLKMVGYTREDLLAGRVKWKELTPPEYAHLDEKALREMDETGACVPFEKEYIRRDGRRFPVLLGASFQEGTRDRGVCFVLDVSERHCAEAAVKESEEKFRKLMESANDAILLADAETGMLIDANPCAEHLLGFRREELIGLHQTRIHPAEEAERYAKLFQDSVQRGVAVVEDIYVVHRDGRRIPVGVSASLFEAGGRRILQGIFRDLTERRRGEALLRVSEQRLQYALQGANDGLWDWNVKTGEVYFSERHVRMLGYEPGELAPHVSSWEKLVHPDDWSHVKEVLNAHLEGRSNHFEAEYRLRTKGGGWMWILDRGRVVERDRGGQPLRMAGTHSDLTERKRIEEVLHRSQENLLLAQQIGQTGSWEADLVRNTIEWSDETFRIFGLKRESFVPTPEGFFQLLPDGDRELVSRSLEHSMQTGEPFMAEHRILRPDGSERHVIGRARALCDATGRPTKMLGTVQDITARKRAETLAAGQNRALEMIATGRPLPEVLDSLTHLMEVVLPGTLCSILLLDDDGVTLRHGSRGSLPAGFCEVIDGEKAAEGAGSCGTAVVRKAAVMAGDIVSDPLWINYRSIALEYGLHACWSVPLLSAENRVLGTFANYYREPRLPESSDLRLLEAVSSVTGIAIERARAEARIRTLNAELEQRVLQRTAQLEAANTELEAFSYSVSHDLRAPLRHVVGFTNLLKQQQVVGADPNARRMAETIAGAALKMGNLIDDLLVFSRMGRTELHSQPISLTRLVGEVMAGLQQDLAGRDVEWTVGPLPVIRGDVAMLRQVFQNLLANAVKYTRDRPRAVIDISSEQRSDEVVFTVRDNGVGFDMQFAGKLFGVFQRLHREEDFEGTGIGLANVRRIVTRHGGRTWAEAKLNQGATFYFSLPTSALVESRPETPAGILRP